MNATRIPDGYYTKAQMVPILMGYSMTTDILPRSKKRHALIATAAPLWEINGFKALRITIADRPSTYGERLYRIEYLA